MISVHTVATATLNNNVTFNIIVAFVIPVVVLLMSLPVTWHENISSLLSSGLWPTTPLTLTHVTFTHGQHTMQTFYRYNPDTKN